MYVVSVQAHYDSAHFLRNYKGKCERLHGHNYRVRVYVGADELDSIGMVVDFVALKRALMEVVRRFEAETLLAGVESPAVFKPTIDKPSQLSANDLQRYLDAAKQRGIDVSSMAVALQRKYAGPFNILIMAFIGMPLAVSFGKKGTVIALCVAVVVGIAYWAVGGGFQQLGNHGLLRPTVAGWSPLLIFAAAGTYFLSRVRT